MNRSFFLFISIIFFSVLSPIKAQATDWQTQNFLASYAKFKPTNFLMLDREQRYGAFFDGQNTRGVAILVKQGQRIRWLEGWAAVAIAPTFSDPGYLTFTQRHYFPEGHIKLLWDEILFVAHLPNDAFDHYYTPFASSCPEQVQMQSNGVMEEVSTKLIRRRPSKSTMPPK